MSQLVAARFLRLLEPSPCCNVWGISPNPMERWLRELTEKRIRRGPFCSVKELVAAIREHLDRNNREPTPFVWKDRRTHLGFSSS